MVTVTGWGVVPRNTFLRSLEENPILGKQNAKRIEKQNLVDLTWWPQPLVKYLDNKDHCLWARTSIYYGRLVDHLYNLNDAYQKTTARLQVKSSSAKKHETYLNTLPKIRGICAGTWKKCHKNHHINGTTRNLYRILQRPSYPGILPSDVL